MKRICLLVLCGVVGLGASRAGAEKKWPPPGSQYGDPRLPQGTLRAFAAALSKADLARAASYIDEAKPVANLGEIKRAMKEDAAEYSIERLQIATNGDRATVAFNLAIHGIGRFSETRPSWAVLRRKGGRWSIDAMHTLDISDSIDPFSSFVSLMSGRRFSAEERGDSGTQATKLLDLGHFVNEFAGENKDRYVLTIGQLRQALLPKYPTVDVLLRGAKGEQAPISFNSKLSGVDRKKVRFPNRTVLLYTGKNGKLSYNRQGRAFVTFVRGFVVTLRPSDEKSLKLLWSP